MLGQCSRVLDKHKEGFLPVFIALGSESSQLSALLQADKFPIPLSSSSGHNESLGRQTPVSHSLQSGLAHTPVHHSSPWPHLWFRVSSSTSQSETCSALFICQGGVCCPWECDPQISRWREGYRQSLSHCIWHASLCLSWHYASCGQGLSMEGYWGTSVRGGHRASLMGNFGSKAPDGLAKVSLELHLEPPPLFHWEQICNKVTYPLHFLSQAFLLMNFVHLILR